MSKWKSLYKADLQRYGDSKVDPYIKRWTYLFRKTQNEKGIIQKIYHLRLMHLGAKHGLEIDYPVTIGAGFFIAHPYGITINDKSILGNNCNISKGVTIGQENRGMRKGVPVIGDNVWIGVNSTIVGRIRIGNDVLIAPNTYLNKDVPDHSIVIGNPAKIISKNNATENYINNIVENVK